MGTLLMWFLYRHNKEERQIRCVSPSRNFFFVCFSFFSLVNQLLSNLSRFMEYLLTIRPLPWNIIYIASRYIHPKQNFKSQICSHWRFSPLIPLWHSSLWTGSLEFCYNFNQKRVLPYFYQVSSIITHIFVGVAQYSENTRLYDENTSEDKFNTLHCLVIRLALMVTLNRPCGYFAIFKENMTPFPTLGPVHTGLKWT